MSRAKVMAYTVVVRHPETDAPTAVLAGEPVPGWAKDLVHDDDLVKGRNFDDGDQDKAKTGGAAAAPADGGDELTEPPRAGRGSGIATWVAYAGAIDLEVPEGASRGDVIALVDAHNAES